MIDKMNIINIDVPENINYISEWTDLDKNLPQGHCIIDKTITGCGFTEYFLHNSQNVILCSPRKILLENKSDQHQDEVFYVKNEIEKNLGVDQELPKTVKKEDLDEYLHQDTPEEIEEKQKHILQLKQNISDYIDQRGISGKSFKILVTYDSIKHVLEVLKQKFPSEIINTFQFVVDEFQSIFTDSKFKGNVELDFIDYLQGCHNVCYLSATPMIEKYLDKIPEFKDLPYYKLIWPKDKVVKAKIIRKRVKSIIDEAGRIINDYRNGIYPRKVLESGEIHESKEVVFYVNSVKTICSIVKKYNLTPDETNIICSRDDKNKKKLRAVKHTFGRVPLQTEDNKMFTFCTRTVYLGADFYSESAYTIVFSDCNIESLAVDISLDLPQILGRQRLDCNVFKNECTLYYKIQKTPITKERFDQHVSNKRKQTELMLKVFEEGSAQDLDRRKAVMLQTKQNLFFKYKIDYLGVREKTDSLDFNHLVELSEERAWEVSQLDYQDNITVKKVLEFHNYQVEDSELMLDNNILQCNFMDEFSKLTIFEEKMKLYCDFLDSYYHLLKTTDIYGVPREYQNYVNLLGTKRIKSLSYKRVNLENEFQIIMEQDQVKSSILLNFTFPSFYPSNNVKSRLQELYNSLGIKKKAKATDLGEYFEIRNITKRIDGNPVKCIELLKLKE